MVGKDGQCFTDLEELGQKEFFLSNPLALPISRMAFSFSQTVDLTTGVTTIRYLARARVPGGGK